MTDHSASRFARITGRRGVGSSRQSAAALVVAALVAFAAASAPAVASAQECRRSCRVDETRDANGCCVSAQSSSPPASLPRRCPGGSSWDERQRACIGRMTCPSGTHMEGSRCIADVIACPSGTRMEEGRCIADISCPAGSRLDGTACVTDVQCPPGTRLENNRCTSSDVTCPPGTTRQGNACVGDPVCPDGSNFVEGRGCTVAVPCPPGMHGDNGVCVPDRTCLEGQVFQPGQGCVGVCLAYANARWNPDRHACVCNEGYTLLNGACEIQQGCAAGTHMDGGACVADVVCPYGYRFVRGVGCVDPDTEAEARRTAREAAEARRRRWGTGPAVQFFAGGGVGAMFATNALRGFYRFSTGAVSPVSGEPPRLNVNQSASWLNAAVGGGASFNWNDFVVQVQFTHIPGAQNTCNCRRDINSSSPVELTPNLSSFIPTTLENGGMETAGYWNVTPNGLNLLTVDVGVQGVGPIHAWRLFGGGGIDIGGDSTIVVKNSMGIRELSRGWISNGGVLEVGYRSQFRVVAGLFLGIEVRGMLMLSSSSFGGTYCYARNSDRMYDSRNPMTPETNNIQPCNGSSVYQRGETDLYPASSVPVDRFNEIGINVGGAGQVFLGYSVF